MNWRQDADAGRGRAWFLGATLAFAALAGWLLIGGRTATLNAIGVPTMELPFADVRTVTGASIALAQGLDPLVSNPGDPWLRPLNYPRIWLVLPHVGFGPQHSELLATFFCFTFLLGLYLLSRLATTPAIAFTMALAL